MKFTEYYYHFVVTNQKECRGMSHYFDAPTVIRRCIHEALGVKRVQRIVYRRGARSFHI